MAEEKYIQFVANYDDWVAIKKLKVEQATDPKTVMEFLAGLTISIDDKVEANLGKAVDLKKLDSALNELSLGKGDTSKALAEVNGRKINSIIDEITSKPEFQKNEQKELKGFCKAYAMKKALKACGLNVDYSGVEIPGMKRLKKIKV
ncbi:MAG: DUF2666 family protein [Candidatus Diapherotrites archaeon]|uniref:DUF2666 family protein n=1 Tax=Candidatus Iainarchaeum sp. TaxID=3101447 RepID=A0A7J4ITZ6_9ARCH|nr:MAG: hypothetical protein QT03_C0001G0785 [archaeon GW2011_AR10]MBS3059678.1 DUF2666 family protein [Candidatus Diapherotrites archaeon]HIH08963.1 DUF2666 family protein [Candidatus Diapherotrites archaeon]